MKITKENFQSEVVESSKPVIVDFYADWCGPCKIEGNILKELENERLDVKIVKVNIDNNRELAKQYGVMSIPTLLIYNNGTLKNKHVGLLNKEEIIKLIEDSTN